MSVSARSITSSMRSSMWKVFPGLDINGDFLYKNRVEISTTLFDCIHRVTGLSKDELQKGRRLRQHVEARYVYWLIMRDMFKTITLAELGNIFGKDHATVLHAVKEARNWISPKSNGTVVDVGFYYKYMEVKKLLNQFLGQ